MRGGLTLRVLSASALLAIIVGGAFAFLLAAISAQREAAALSLQSHEVLASADRLQRLVVDLETGARGYFLTGEESFLQPWTAAHNAVRPEMANLQRLSTLPDQHQKAVEIAAAVGSYVDNYSVPLVEAARRGDAAVRSVAITLEGKRRVDDIRARFDGLDGTERRLAANRDASSVVTANQAVIVAACGLGISLVLTLVLAAYLTRSIVRPVLRTARMATQLADGDLSTRIAETGLGEIRTLERSFNRMGAALERNRAELDGLLREQAALRRTATLVAHGAPPSTVFAAVVEEAGTVLDVDGAAMLRQEADTSATVMASWGVAAEQAVGETIVAEDVEGTVTGRVFETGRSAWQRSFPGEGDSVVLARLAELGARLTVGAPITVEGRVWGSMGVVSLRPREPEEIERRLVQFTDLVATAIANSQAREDLAASRARVVAAGDQVRRRIERDLHDGVQQRLVSLALDLRRAEADVPAELTGLRVQLSDVASKVGATLDDLRVIARGIHPAVLSKGGLEPALKALARRSAVPVDLDVRLPTRPPPPVEVAAYYVVAEALTNTAKHAAASEVRIDVAMPNDRLEISVSDDGVGGADPARGSGLMGLTDRIDALGGRILINSPPGEGTRLRIELPAAAAG